MKKTSDNKPATKKDLKQLEQKLLRRAGNVENHLEKVDRSLLAFKGEVEDRFQSLEDKIDKSEGRVVGLLGEVMIEIKELRQSHEIFTGKTYDNVDRLDNHEARIKILEQRSPATL